MKTNLFKIFALVLGMSILVSSCKKDEEPGVPATLADFTIAADNATATIVFSEAVYKTADKTGNLDATAFNVTYIGGTATVVSFAVEHTAGTASVNMILNIEGVANGQEVLTVSPNANSIFNSAGVAMLTTESKSANLKEIGIIGKWYSSGANVSLLLVTYFGVDSIYADFKADNTYLVESFTTAGSKTTMTGTFTQAKSTTGSIWEITVSQSSPSSLISEGIFELYAGTDVTMKYEIAQTDPQTAGVTPPTPVGGFGSTSGGAFGLSNVQTYIRF